MAAQTLLIASAEGCNAILHWDDATHTATFITADNTQGALAVTFFILISGVFHATKVQPGGTATVGFPTALSVTIQSILIKPGQNGMVFGNVSAWGIGFGSGIGGVV